MPQTVVTDALMEAFVIEGARPLTGSIRAAGNKNAALPIVAACLLTGETVRLANVPAITDVEMMLAPAASMTPSLPSPSRACAQGFASPMTTSQP